MSNFKQLPKELLLTELEYSKENLQYNYELLNDSLKDYLTEMRARNDLEDEKDFSDRMKKISILLHNYLASVYSFLQHFHSSSNEVFKTGFKEEAEKVWKSFKSEPINAFVRDLRNYAQHRKLPIVGIRVTYFFNRDGIPLKKPKNMMCYTPSLEIKSLKLFKKWSAPSKELIKYAGNEIEIMAFIPRFHDNVLVLFKWLITQIKNW